MNKQKDNEDGTPKITHDHLAEFEPLLDDINIPDDQKREFLALLWSIMVEFAALGFGADAASQAIAAQLSDAVTDSQPEHGRLSLTQVFDTAKLNAPITNDNEVQV